MDKEELGLEATYWREALKMIEEMRNHLKEINELLPEVVNTPRIILTIQMTHLLPVTTNLVDLTQLIQGRANYLSGKVNGDDSSV